MTVVRLVPNLLIVSDRAIRWIKPLDSIKPTLPASSPEEPAQPE
jgi:hypothetical protein